MTRWWRGPRESEQYKKMILLSGEAVQLRGALVVV